jgi:hypothetical protein
MEITCLTRLEPENKEENLFSLYDIIELEFELSEAIQEKEVFCCVHLGDFAVYVYRDNIAIDGKRFKVEIPNFLDCLKSLPSANLKGKDIEMAIQVEFDLNSVFTVPNNELWIPNPWYTA